MIIDTHQHAFWHGRDAAGLVADMDEQGIDFAWLLSWEIPHQENAPGYHQVLNPAHMRADGTHPGIPFSDVLLARDRYPSRFVLGYCPDPRLGDAPGLFESAYNIHGVRVCGEWKLRVGIDDPRCVELFRRAGELKCPVVLHLDVPYLVSEETGELEFCSNWYGGTVENLRRAMDACPETIFVGHAPGFWREISGSADADAGSYPKTPVTPGGRLHKLFDSHPNLHADLSAGSALNALRRSPDHAKEFLCRFADQLMFARDFYGGDMNEFLQTLDLPADVQKKLYSGNALKLVQPPPGRTEA